MKPQDMTNEQLAAKLLEPLPHGWAVREAARRLQNKEATDMIEPNLHNTTDASVWAAEFCKRWPSALCQITGKEGVSDGDDFESTMVGWFANAIMVGVDSENRTTMSERDGRKRAEEALRRKDAAINDLFKLLDANGVDYSHLIP